MRTQRNESLAQAMALLIQNQAAFVAQLGEGQKKFVKLEARLARVERRLEDIEATLRAHSEILAQLSEAVAQLPEAVRLKIGFKPKS